MKKLISMTLLLLFCFMATNDAIGQAKQSTATHEAPAMSRCKPNNTKLVHKSNEQSKAQEIAEVQRKKEAGIYHHPMPAKGYRGDYSPDAIEHLKSIGYPIFVADKNNYRQSKVAHSKAVEQWKQECGNSVDQIMQKIKELNKNYRNK